MLAGALPIGRRLGAVGLDLLLLLVTLGAMRGG